MPPCPGAWLPAPVSGDADGVCLADPGPNATATVTTTAAATRAGPIAWRLLMAEAWDPDGTGSSGRRHRPESRTPGGRSTDDREETSPRSVGPRRFDAEERTPTMLAVPTGIPLRACAVRWRSAPALERLEEGHDLGCEPLRLFHADHVRDVVPDEGTGIGRVGREVPRGLNDFAEIEHTSDREDRTAELREALAGDGIELHLPALHPGGVVERQVHLGKEYPRAFVEPSGGLSGAVAPDRRLEVRQSGGIEWICLVDGLVRLEDPLLFGSRTAVEPTDPRGDAHH